MARRRVVLAVSLSPANPDAVAVAEALRGVPDGRRSAALLAWAAAYLRGEVGARADAASDEALDEGAIDALLDDF